MANRSVILGVIYYRNDSTASIVEDGKLIAAIEEERLNRFEHMRIFLHKAVDRCLKMAGIRTVGFTFNPYCLNEHSKESLRIIVGFIQTNGGLKADLSGHSDSYVPEQFNLCLPEKWAQQALDYLLLRAQNTSRIILPSLRLNQLLNRYAEVISCTTAEDGLNERMGIEVTSFKRYSRFIV